MTKNIYLMEHIDNELYLFKLKDFAIFFEKFFIRKGVLKEKKVSIAIKHFIKQYLEERTHDIKYKNDHFNFYFNRNVTNLFNNYYLNKFREENDNNSLSIYDFIYRNNSAPSFSTAYSFKLLMNESSKEKIFLKKFKEEIIEKNYMFLFKELFSIFENQDILYISDKQIDLSNIFDFSSFIEIIYDITKSKEILDFKIDKFKELDKKFKELEENTVTEEVALERDEIPF